MNYYNFMPNMGNMNYQGQTNYEQKNYQMQKDNLYDPYQGFIRGNMFKDLYDPYKLNNPYNIEPANDQAKMLTCIDALSFAMIDLNLYLDIYPNDTNMLNLRDKYLKEYETAKKNYETKYGAITTYSETLNKTPWNWDSSFPWEVNK